jgi:hypothetical protein
MANLNISHRAPGLAGTTVIKLKTFGSFEVAWHWSLRSTCDLPNIIAHRRSFNITSFKSIKQQYKYWTNLFRNFICPVPIVNQMSFVQAKSWGHRERNKAAHHWSKMAVDPWSVCKWVVIAEWDLCEGACNKCVERKKAQTRRGVRICSLWKGTCTTLASYLFFLSWSHLMVDTTTPCKSLDEAANFVCKKK